MKYAACVLLLDKWDFYFWYGLMLNYIDRAGEAIWNWGIFLLGACVYSAWVAIYILLPFWILGAILKGKDCD